MSDVDGSKDVDGGDVDGSSDGGTADGAERRRFQRVDVPLLVQIRYAATEPPRTVYALNLSERGLFIDVDDGKPLGTRVQVQITTRDGQQRVRGEGRVVRRAGGGVGVELVGFDDEARQILTRIMSDADR